RRLPAGGRRGGVRLRRRLRRRAARRARLARPEEPLAPAPGLRRRAALLDARDDPRVRPRAAELVRRAGRRLRAACRLDGGRRPARTLLGLCTLRMLSGSSENLREASQEALEACEQLADDYSLAQAWNLVGRVEGTVMGSLATGEEAWRQGLSFARRGNYRA